MAAHKYNLSLKADHPPSVFFGFVLSFVAAGVGLAQALGNSHSMDIIKELKNVLKKGGHVVRVCLPFIDYYGVGFDDLLNSKTIDERIERLDKIRDELNAAISAVVELKDEAIQSKEEAKVLQQKVDQLQQDKNTAETLLQVPEESFSRLISKANAKARLGGILEGLAIGFITGCASSLLVWYFTK